MPRMMTKKKVKKNRKPASAKAATTGHKTKETASAVGSYAGEKDRYAVMKKKNRKKIRKILSGEKKVFFKGRESALNEALREKYTSPDTPGTGKPKGWYQNPKRHKTFNKLMNKPTTIKEKGKKKKVIKYKQK